MEVREKSSERKRRSYLGRQEDECNYQNQSITDGQGRCRFCPLGVAIRRSLASLLRAVLVWRWGDRLYWVVPTLLRRFAEIGRTIWAVA